MLTKEQALELTYGHAIHINDRCHFIILTRGATKLVTPVWRVNGEVKVWLSKRNAHRFRVPLKYGLYAYDYLDQDNAHLLHLPNDCPALKAYDEYMAQKGSVV